jgi:hypothetical protein
MIQPYFSNAGDYPELAFMSLMIFEGASATGRSLVLWSSPTSRGGTSILVVGRGTYTIESSTNYNCDIFIEIWEFLPTGSPSL